MQMKFKCKQNQLKRTTIVYGNMYIVHTHDRVLRELFANFPNLIMGKTFTEQREINTLIAKCRLIKIIACRPLKWHSAGMQLSSLTHSLTTYYVNDALPKVCLFNYFNLTSAHAGNPFQFATCYTFVLNK